ncbi:MAG: GNAT family N-acetyltransferase [Candidatus Hodarchaeota archaeon]
MQNREIVEAINDKDLYLRKISLSDSKFFFTSLKEEVISKFLSLGPLTSQEHSKKLIKNYLKYWDKQTQFNYIIEIRKQNNIGNDIKKIGSVSIWNISWVHKRAEVGIWIIPRYWHQGMAEKAINLIKTIAFYHLNLNRLEAHIAINNKESVNLFKKCNFIEEGILKNYLNLRGTFTNAVILASLRK